jgi:NAD(P)-dependent dehydrogenase (short-subunit alcohol dehydrogenase family)
MTSPRQFEKQVVLVTGAASGIGRATALGFAREGARVIIADIQENEGKKTLELLQKMGTETQFIQCNVADSLSVHELFQSILKYFGRLDHAFNNAGTEGLPATIVESTAENWNRTLGVNLSGVYWCMKEELSIMLHQRKGTIVNCSSIAGVRGFERLGAYTASKHGVIGLTKSAALDYSSQNIRVNAVCPGVIQTPMIDRFTGGIPENARQLEKGAPMNRMGKAEEIADAVLWLCSERSSFVTGAEIVVDGGWCAK